MFEGPEEVRCGEDWFAVRCVLRVAELNLYEERITLWRTDSFEEAIALAETEVEDHARIVESEYVGLAQAYRLADQPGHGAEVFSLMRESQLDPETYIATFFSTGTEREGIVDDE
jgi:hypothetical protein